MTKKEIHAHPLFLFSLFIERLWDYELYFASSSTSFYVGPMEVSDFLETTVCWWIMLPSTGSNTMAVFSLTNDQDINAFSFHDLENHMDIFVNGDQRSVAKTADVRGDSLWHHVCVTWRSSDGRWGIHVDGNRVEKGFNLSSGVHVAPGKLVIGQQWSTAYSYDTSFSFEGNLSHFNMWNMEIAEGKISRMSLSCGAEVGNLLPWPEMKTWRSSSVSVKKPSSCKVKGMLS